MKKKSTPQKKSNADVNVERRKFHRRQVLETFHVFLCVQKRGLGKLKLRDISENGFAFEAEPEDKFIKNERVECLFFINPGLSFALSFRVAYVEIHKQDEQGLQIIGAEITNVDSKLHQAYISFVKLLDQLAKLTDIYNPKLL